MSQTTPILRRFVVVLGSLALALCCTVARPAAAQSTLTFTGQVYSPLGPPVSGSSAVHGDPIPNILVFVQDPNTPLPVFSQGVAPMNGLTGCAGQPSLVPSSVLGSALTDYSGTFTFNAAPSQFPINVVIQAGKWRRQYQFTQAQIAGYTSGVTVALPAMTMPSSLSQGDLPHIAVVTGSADAIECIFPQIGIATSEITDPTGAGSINLFSGNASSGEVVSTSSPTETELVNPSATKAIPISNYDMVIFGCQSWADGTTDSDVPLYANNVEAFANEGGRVFGTHGEAVWITTPTDWSGIATFGGTTASGNTQTGQLSTDYTGEPTLAAWMNYIGALDINAAKLQFSLTSVFYNLTAVSAPGQTWVTLPSHSNSPNQLSFDTPVAATGTPTAQLNFTNTQANYDLGDTGDSVVINTTDTSATATLSGLTLTLQIPAGISPTNLVDTTPGGAWTCTLTTPTATCVMGAPLAPGAADAVTLTFNIPLTTVPGSATIIGTLGSNGGLNNSNQCGRVLYNDYHVESSITSKTLFDSGVHCGAAGSLTNAQKFLEYSLYNLSNFVAPTTSDTLVIQSPTITTITTSGYPGVTTPIEYGEIIGDTGGVNAIVSTTAPAGANDGNLTVDVDNTLVCTLPNTGTGGTCPNAGFSGQNVGTHTVQAFYSGDTNYQASQSPVYDVLVQPDPTTLTLTTSGSPSIVGSPVTFTATAAAPYATPTGPVEFFVDGVAATSVTLSSAGVATFSISTLTVGAHTILATYAATQNFLASSSAPVSQVVVYPAATTTTTLSSSVNPSYYLQNVTFAAQVTATTPLPGPLAGTVTFYDGTTLLATSPIDVNGDASYATTALTVGTHSITAVFTPATPNPTSLTSTSSAVSQVVQPNTFTLAVDPTTLALTVGSSVSVNITIADQGDFNEPVALTCTGPSAAAEIACSFLSATIPPGGGATRLTFTPAAPHPCAAVTTSSLGSSGSRLGWLGLGLSTLLFVLLRKRRRLVQGITLALALCCLPLLNGCGTSGCTDFGVLPGTYVVTVTATAAAPNALTLTQNVTITVKP